MIKLSPSEAETSAQVSLHSNQFPQSGSAERQGRARIETLFSQGEFKRALDQFWPSNLGLNLLCEKSVIRSISQGVEAVVSKGHGPLTFLAQILPSEALKLLSAEILTKYSPRPNIGSYPHKNDLLFLSDALNELVNVRGVDLSSIGMDKLEQLQAACLEAIRHDVSFGRIRAEGKKAALCLGISEESVREAQINGVLRAINEGRDDLAVVGIRALHFTPLEKEDPRLMVTLERYYSKMGHAASLASLKTILDELGKDRAFWARQGVQHLLELNQSSAAVRGIGIKLPKSLIGNYNQASDPDSKQEARAAIIDYLSRNSITQIGNHRINEFLASCRELNITLDDLHLAPNWSDVSARLRRATLRALEIGDIAAANSWIDFCASRQEYQEDPDMIDAAKKGLSVAKEAKKIDRIREFHKFLGVNEPESDLEQIGA